MPDNGNEAKQYVTFQGEIAERLRELALADRRSVAAEAAILIEEALAARQASQSQAVPT